MLVSHRKRFIFTKTVKTAGTSVESYFEKYCMPDGEWQESHSRKEYVSETGIIGCRGANAKESTWYNHMSAADIRERVGREVWDNYYKFTVIRNPFEKLISGFSMFEHDKLLDRIEGETPVERFRNWVQNGGSIRDRNKYLIDREECVDYFIRFEDLHGGIKHVCDHLSIPFEPSRVPEFKKGIRDDTLGVREYYDNETERLVRKRYAWEFEKFGYELTE